MRIEPDGTFGAIIASESLGLTETVINGPGGCRDRAHILLGLMIDPEPDAVELCSCKNFSKRSGLPCMFINGNDIVYGASEKIKRTADEISDVSGKRISVIETLGASLICIDYSNIVDTEKGDVVIDEDLSSMSFSEGFDKATSRILDTHIRGERHRSDIPSVNILGYCIADLGWEAGSMQLIDLLEMMGVKVNANISCRPTPEQVQSSKDSWLNILIDPAISRGTAELYSRRYSIPYLRPKEGRPFGVDSMVSLLREVGQALDVDPSPSIDYLMAEADRLHGMMLRAARRIRSLRGRRFSIEGQSS